MLIVQICDFGSDGDAHYRLHDPSRQMSWLAGVIAVDCHFFSRHLQALADIADGLGDRAANVHFEDRVEDGKILFDYVMRPGVVRKSNALELMRSVGLEI